MSTSLEKTSISLGYMSRPWRFRIFSLEWNRRDTYFAEWQRLCSSGKAHGPLCTPPRDMPACHLQRLFFPPRYCLWAWAVVLSQAAALQNISDESSLMCEPQLSEGKEQNERKVRERHSKIVHMNQTVPLELWLGEFWVHVHSSRRSHQISHVDLSECKTS